MRDLLNVACSHEPSTRLQLIYQWYYDRTMTAIRVAYGAAAAASAALYALVVNPPDSIKHEWLLSRALAAAAVICVGAGIFQRRELAQLHTEFAAASRLLNDLKGLPTDEMYSPRDRQPGPPKWKGRLAFTILVVVAVALGIIFADTPSLALTVVAFLIPLLAVPHIAAEMRHMVNELRHGPRPPPTDDKSQTLEKVFGDIRLDQYILHSPIQTTIDRSISERLECKRRREGTWRPKGWL